MFIAKGAKESLLVTRNLVPGDSVYGEKRIAIESVAADDGEKVKTEYRVWNPFRSKLAAGILSGLDDIFIAPGKKVLYLGAASGTSVSHVADVVGPVRMFVRAPCLNRAGGLCLRGRVLAPFRSRPHQHGQEAHERHPSVSRCLAPALTVQRLSRMRGIRRRRARVCAVDADPPQYRMLVGMVDVIFADVAQPDQAVRTSSQEPS